MTKKRAYRGRSCTLQVESMEERICLSDVTFTVRLVDQSGSEIIGSAITVPGVGVVASGSTVTTSSGGLDFRISPTILDTDPLANGGGLLSRVERRDVDSTTSVVEFSWPVRQVQLNLADQHGVAIVGTNGQPSRFFVAHTAARPAGGSIVALPVTDDPLYPTLGGIFADGYDLTLAPAILDTDPLVAGGGLLARTESAVTTEVGLGTTALDFEWAVAQVQLNLRDQSGAAIVGLDGQPSAFGFSNSAVSLANGTVAALPITDNAAYPTATGIWADGYDLLLVPAILDTRPSGTNGGLLARTESAVTTEVGLGTTALDFEWAVAQVQLNLRDQSGAAIVGLDGQPSAFGFSNSAVSLANGTVAALPITDNAAYPTATGIWADGYDLLLVPAILDTRPSGTNGGLLARTESAVTTEVYASTTALDFEWISVRGPLYVVDQQEYEIVGSQYIFSNSAAVLTTGREVALPITDNAVYPTATGIWADGYDVFLRPDGASSFAGTFDFELAGDGLFSPRFVTIGGAAVGLSFTAARRLVVDAGPDATIDEGNTFSGSGSFVGASGQIYMATVDYGDGSGPQPLALAGRGFLLDHRYTDDGTFPVTVGVTDGAGHLGLDTTVVTVRNVAPTAIITGGPTGGVRGRQLSFTGEFTDPGADTHTTTWRVLSEGTSIASGSGMSFAFTPTLTGAYTVEFAVADDDGGVGTDSASVNVGAVLLQPDPCDPTKMALVIGGTSGADDIRVTPAAVAGSVEVTLNGASLGTFTPTGRIMVYGQAGDDDIQVAGGIGLSAWLHGGGGDDRLKGGAGHDVLLGQAGDDLLTGSQGRDLMIGGAGADRLVGNADDDILIAGYTAFDADDAALCALMDEWTSGRDYASRVANLNGRGAGDRLNGCVFLKTEGPDATVHDDGEADVLTGSSGLDWFLFNLYGAARDRVTDLGDAEFANDLDFING